MEISAYTPAQLQAARTLLTDAVAAGLDLHTLLARIERGLPAAPVVMVRPAGQAQASAPRLCPSCGRGPLAPVSNRDGLRILGCRLCRYSEVV